MTQVGEGTRVRLETFVPQFHLLNAMGDLEDSIAYAETHTSETFCMYPKPNSTRRETDERGHIHVIPHPFDDKVESKSNFNFQVSLL